MTAPSRAEIEAACGQLASKDKALARALDVCDVPDWRARPLSFRLLAELVTHQLISVAAAAQIWQRTQALLAPDVSPGAFLACDEVRLRQAGQSRPKIAHMRSIATAIETGQLDLERLARCDAQTARETLLAVKGIGPWTAELVMLYGRGELDAFPSGDVGLMESYRQLSCADKRLTSAEFTALAERWRPSRGVAAHLLWAWLHYERNREKTAKER